MIGWGGKVEWLMLRGQAQDEVGSPLPRGRIMGEGMKMWIKLIQKHATLQMTNISIGMDYSNWLNIIMVHSNA